MLDNGRTEQTKKLLTTDSTSNILVYMKIIDVLEPQKGSTAADSMIYSTQVKADFTGETFQESWAEIEDLEDEEVDELQLSFREGNNKRTASDEFYCDLKRIKFDNNVRDLTNDMSSFKLHLPKANTDTVSDMNGSKNFRRANNPQDIPQSSTMTM